MARNLYNFEKEDNIFTGEGALPWLGSCSGVYIYNSSVLKLVFALRVTSNFRWLFFYCMSINFVLRRRNMIRPIALKSKSVMIVTPITRPVMIPSPESGLK